MSSSLCSVIRYNVAVCGKNGMGKTTLMKALFNSERREAHAKSELYKISEDYTDPQHNGLPTTDGMSVIGRLKMTYHDRAASHGQACKDQELSTPSSTRAGSATNSTTRIPWTSS